MADELNVEFEKGDWDNGIKGCYAYNDGSYSKFYYGTGGDTFTLNTELTLPMYRPHGYDCSTNCVPHSETACKAVADHLNLTFKRGNWGTKGCYAYYKGEYAGNIYYSTGGTLAQNEADVGGSSYRPFGVDCNYDCIPYSATACLEAGKRLNLTLSIGSYGTHTAVKI